MTGRSVPEWIGATPDTAIPTRVRLRLWERCGGTCALTGRKLGPGEWDIDHKKPLADGGEHREANLQIVWRPKHREKTAVENSDRAKADRIFAKHHNQWPKSKRPLKGRSFAKSRNTIAAEAAEESV
jgi:5-methylcytosine-specific restriction endonuclease McrA